MESVPSTIRAILIKCGIKLRTNSESHRGKRPWEAMEKHHGWKGDKAKAKAGNQRARHLYPCPKDLERHHIDGNPLNNAPENIVFVTRKNHQLLDGRLTELLPRIHPLAVAGRLKYCEKLRRSKKLEAYKP
jgi:hypothetical protein